ncbi:hypothetical protein GYMLUDRAFT_245336 [Collybiopsis luxurians FD-317 M1]|uniref:Uncharacterized protein n=1 Tax=Collybiopsis luxurians FD-317 M1 TaxID=944289 RepID=A0A0D0CL52_9AGAR|nr:hypothetical protein GYMLUDRAFT_245336 [Collybiopsis luxurians FD-317 M1]
MIPSIGHGETMAFEDAVILAILNPADTRREDIPLRFKLGDELLRIARAGLVGFDRDGAPAVSEKLALYYRSK